jgi:sulfatase modifying factor 1
MLARIALVCGCLLGLLGAGAQTLCNAKDGAVLTVVPAGWFIMGSREGAGDAGPARHVWLDGYLIYTGEVTAGQYRQFCAETRRRMPRAPAGGWRDDWPMVNVAWHDADAYARWAGGALPTEAQWEKAARGTDGRAFPWGDQWEETRCRARENEPAPPGACPPGASPYGAQDMAGNVWEWCRDWYDPAYYASAPACNPAGPLKRQAGYGHALRGGSFLFRQVDDYRCWHRNYASERFFSTQVGFRCVLPLTREMGIF